MTKFEIGDIIEFKDENKFHLLCPPDYRKYGSRAVFLYHTKDGYWATWYRVEDSVIHLLRKAK